MFFWVGKKTRLAAGVYEATDKIISVVVHALTVEIGAPIILAMNDAILITDALGS